MCIHWLGLFPFFLALEARTTSLCHSPSLPFPFSLKFLVESLEQLGINHFSCQILSSVTMRKSTEFLQQGPHVDLHCKQTLKPQETGISSGSRELCVCCSLNHGASPSEWILVLYLSHLILYISNIQLNSPGVPQKFRNLWGPDVECFVLTWVEKRNKSNG